MAKKLEITLTHGQAEALTTALQSIVKQTATVTALTEIVTTANDTQIEAKKVVLALPVGKATALAKTLVAVPKQTKTVEKLNTIVTAAIAAQFADAALTDTAV